MINILKILFPSENKGGRRVRPLWIRAWIQLVSGNIVSWCKRGLNVYFVLDGNHANPMGNSCVPMMKFVGNFCQSAAQEKNDHHWY